MGRPNIIIILSLLRKLQYYNIIFIYYRVGYVCWRDRKCVYARQTNYYEKKNEITIIIRYMVRRNNKLFIIVCCRASRSTYADLMKEYVTAETVGKHSKECYPYFKECPKSLFQNNHNNYSWVNNFDILNFFLKFSILVPAEFATTIFRSSSWRRVYSSS